MPCFNLVQERVVGLLSVLLPECGYIGGAVVHVRMSVRVEFFPHEIFEYGHRIHSPTLGRLDDYAFQRRVERERPFFFSFGRPGHGALL